MLLEFCDDDFDGMELVEGALFLNRAVNPETPVEWAQQELSRMLREAELHLLNERSEEARFDAFLRLFYKEWGFKGDQDAYFSSSNTFIDQVLEHRKGVPVSLGSLLLYWGKRLGFPIAPVTFPTQFLIEVKWHGQPVRYLNPFSGEYVSKKTLAAWLVGQQGPVSQLKREHLAVADHASIIGRWLAVMKNALLREEDYALALRCTDIALKLVPDDPYEIRDRGFIYQQLDCHQVAVDDFNYFIEQCPDDPGVELLRTQVQALSSAPVTLH